MFDAHLAQGEMVKTGYLVAEIAYKQINKNHQCSTSTNQKLQYQ